VSRETYASISYISTTSIENPGVLACNTLRASIERGFWEKEKAQQHIRDGVEGKIRALMVPIGELLEKTGGHLRDGCRGGVARKVGASAGRGGKRRRGASKRMG